MKPNEKELLSCLRHTFKYKLAHTTDDLRRQIQAWMRWIKMENCPDDLMYHALRKNRASEFIVILMRFFEEL